MSSEVLSRARACQACHSSKVSRHVRAPLSRRQEPDSRFSSLHVDLVGPLPPSEGMRYIFTIVDRFSRWVEAVPLPTMTAGDCAVALLRHWITRFGVPSDITTDQGRQFCSDLWRDLHRLLGIKSLRTTAYHPQANGMVERLHRTLKERIMARSTSDWMSHLPLVLFGIRASVLEDSGTSPAELLYGTALRLPGQMLPAVASDDPVPSSDFVLDLQTKMRESVPMPVNFHGRHPVNLPRDLRSASHVFVRVDAVRPPLSRPYEGPFPVLSRSSDLKTFTVDRAGKRWVVSVDRLKPAFFLSDPISGVSPSSSSQDLGLDELEANAQAARQTPLVADVLPPAAPVNAAPPAPDVPLEPDVLAAPLPPAAAVVPVDPVVVPPTCTRSGRVSRPPERFQAGV